MTDAESDLRALHLHLDSHPDDMQARLVLADLLEELGRDSDARCQRWLVENGKWPDAGSRPGSWFWWYSNAAYLRHSVLPSPLRSLVLPGRWKHASRQLAEDFLAPLLDKLRTSTNP